MAEYQFTKSAVNLEKLEAEIKTSPNISQAASYSLYKAPDVLKITFTIDLTAEEQTALQALVSDHSVSDVGEAKFLVKEYDASGRRIIRETWYNTDNGDGTYSGKVTENAYIYNNGKLEKRKEKRFWLDGTEDIDKEWDYFVDGNEKVIEKLVEGV